ncbi:MAG: hypothetical protein IJ830_06875 [Alphaproteobacteria bacterium]|nr:hypothetical protein [Alphaproteobacteria bacterium]
MAVNYKIVNDIVEHVGPDNKPNWYVGIATHPRERLFKDHCVDEQHGRWIYRDAITETDARDTEEHLLKIFKFRGDVGGGNYPTYVYAYKITSYTKQ